MHAFPRHNGQLFVEDLPLESIAEKYGTPCYVYSKSALEQHYDQYALALGDHPGKICYAIKANSNLAVLQILARKGAGFDIVSGGELKRVLAAGGLAENIIFSGVGKTREEMRFALEQGISCFNVESEEELHTLARVAESLKIKAPVSLRVNPDVDAQTHPYISTGLKENKFGIDIAKAAAVYEKAESEAYLDIIGVDCHIGSQLTDTEPFLAALDRLLTLIDDLSERNITISHLDLGGGIGVVYRDEVQPSIHDYIALVKERLGDRQLALYFEPGRSISANAGVLLTEVLYLKPTECKNFAVVDAAMNDNIRPSLYQAWQDIQPLNQRNQGALMEWDIVGPICETGDFLAKDRALALETGDKLALMSSGAYGFVMSSNYNSRGRAAEVLVSKDRSYLVREREQFDDIIRGEHLLGDNED